MKHNNFIFGLMVLGIVSIFISLNNAAQLDALAAALNDVQANINNRANQAVGNNNNVQVVDLLNLLRQINQSGLGAESVRFLFDFLHFNLHNLPTQNELQQLIDVLRNMERPDPDGSGGPGRLGDYLSKYGRRGPGPDGSGGTGFSCG